MQVAVSVVGTELLRVDALAEAELPDE